MGHPCLPIKGCAIGQVLHGSATTTEAIRRAIQRSQESLRTRRSVTGTIRRPSPSGGSGPRLRTFRPARKSRDRRCSTSRRRPLSLPFADIRCCRSMTASMHCSRHPASYAVFAASLPAASRHRPPAGCRWRQAGEEQVQEPPYRLFPH